jgi:TDG/mug DNA glycosylase family protein
MANPKLLHPFPPICSASSKVLILGSFPSEISRQKGYYYANPYNRFWKVMAALFGQKVPQTEEEREKLIIGNHLALWDVFSQVRIEGSADSTIEDSAPNDIQGLIEKTQVQLIAANGLKAYQGLERSYLGPFKVIRLPSTSPAAAIYSLDDLIKAYYEALEPYLGSFMVK